MIPKDIVIVIGRRFGSGGRCVGKILADRLGLRYYDREILSEAAHRLGFDKNIFYANDEKRPSPLLSMLNCAAGASDECSFTRFNRDSFYRAQSDVIRDLGKEGGCVFVGRSADYILRDHPHLTSVFLTAPVEHRARRIMQRDEAQTEAKARDLAKSKDRDRESFYNYFTGRKWGTVDNYHITVDTCGLDDEGVASLVECYLNQKYR